jgi:hypothetical protein
MWTWSSPGKSTHLPHTHMNLDALMGPYITLKRTWCNMLMRWNTYLFYAFVATKFMMMCVHEFPLTHPHSTFELSPPYKDFIKMIFFLFIWIPHWIISGVWICKKGCYFVQKFVAPCLLHNHNYCCVFPPSYPSTHPWFPFHQTSVLIHVHYVSNKFLIPRNSYA